MSRKKTTVSLSSKEFQWARKQMSANDWDRSGDAKGISRYVQELIRADQRRQQNGERNHAPSAVGPPKQSSTDQ